MKIFIFTLIGQERDFMDSDIIFFKYLYQCHVCGLWLHAPPCNLEGKVSQYLEPLRACKGRRKMSSNPSQRAQLGGANVTSQRDSTSTKGKVMALPCESEENLGEASAGSSCPC